jgi:hypothetical protein
MEIIHLKTSPGPSLSSIAGVYQKRTGSLVSGSSLIIGHMVQRERGFYGNSPQFL